MNPTYIEELKKAPSLEEYEDFEKELNELLSEPQTQPKEEKIYIRLYLDEKCNLEVDYSGYKAQGVLFNDKH